VTAISSTTTVGRIVAQSPHLARLFEQWQIDYCCGGKRPLNVACQERGLDIQAVLTRLQEAEPQETSPTDWTTAPLASLCENIERTHHDYLRRELPRLTAIIAKVVNAHGARHPELATVQQTFAELRAELEPHMVKEECVLFPSIRYLESTGQAVQFPFGSVANPIRVMVNEHDHTGDALERLRKLTGDYQPPPGACNTYRVMLEGLATLERDMHVHVHKENSILFPRAVELEGRLGGASEAAHECGCHCSTK
jgi:regulator of cell morphogenesis and NO signaling